MTPPTSEGIVAYPPPWTGDYGKAGTPRSLHEIKEETSIITPTSPSLS